MAEIDFFISKLTLEKKKKSDLNTELWSITNIRNKYTNDEGTKKVKRRRKWRDKSQRYFYFYFGNTFKKRFEHRNMMLYWTLGTKTQTMKVKKKWNSEKKWRDTNNDATKNHTKLQSKNNNEERAKGVVCVSTNRTSPFLTIAGFVNRNHSQYL